MSIADQVQRLQGVKTDIIDAIKGKGVAVPGGAMLGDCPDLIAAITGGGGGDVSVSLANIMPTTGIKVVDDNGYIGGNFLGAYYPSANYYNNFAIKVSGADFSSTGLGSVTFVDNTTTIGGRTYRTVTIGGQTWLAENLDFKFSGCEFNSTSSPATPACWYYDRNESLYGIDGNRHCGLLYNWYAVKLLNDNRADLIPGWHVSSSDEWDALFKAVGGISVAAARLKSVDNVSADGTWPTGWGGSDDYGFGAVPGGRYTGGFYIAGTSTMFWTTLQTTDTAARYYALNNSSTAGAYNTSSKAYAYSVRLVKDT